MSGGFTFNSEEAGKADKGMSIAVGGHYVGVITEMKAFKRDTNAAGVELSFETKSGETCRYIKIYTKNKNGEPNFNVAHVHALMGLLGIDHLPAVQGTSFGETVYLFPSVCGKPIGFTLYRREYRNAQGAIKYGMEIRHFHDAVTHQTYSEKVANALPQCWERDPGDELIGIESSVGAGDFGESPPNVAAQPYVEPAVPEDDLPF